MGKGLKHPATVVAATCVVLVAGGAAYAATSGSAGHAVSSHRLFACVQMSGERGELNLSTASATCPNGGHKISWNIEGRTGRQGPTGRRGATGAAGTTGPQGLAGATGSQGPAGSKGDTGAQGPAGTNGTNGKDGTNGTSVTSTALSAGDANCPNGGSSFTSASGTTYACNGANGQAASSPFWASVNSGGIVLDKGSHVLAVDHFGTGEYNVQFDQNVNNCPRVASLGSILDTSINSNLFTGLGGEIYTFNGGNNSGPLFDTITVDTRDSTGTLADVPFQIVVFC